MRCDQCGATNPDAAAWCNLCFADLTAERAGDHGRQADTEGRRHEGSAVHPTDVAGATVPGSAHAPRSDEARPEDDVVPARTRLEPALDEPADAAAAPRDGFRRGEDGLEWRCPTCGTWAPMDVAACPSCGTAFRERLIADDASAEAASAPPAGRTVLLNALLPGLGHLVAGWPGSGLARLVLYCIWVVGGIGLLSAGGTVVAFPLLLGAFVLWLTAVHDGWQLAQGGPQILSGRILLWLVVGVTVVAIMGVAGAAAVRPG